MKNWFIAVILSITIASSAAAVMDANTAANIRDIAALKARLTSTTSFSNMSTASGSARATKLGDTVGLVGYAGVVISGSGKTLTIGIPSLTGVNTGDVTLGTTNGLSLVGQALSLQPATTTQPGAMTAAQATALSTAVQPVGGVVPVSLGGTGATTAPAALTALGASPVAGSSSLTIIGPLASDATVNQVTVGRGSGNISSNTATGYKALATNTSGTSNTANGYEALFSTTAGSNNTANGYLTLYNNTTGGNNTATGDEALYNNTTGGNNTANGNQAGRYISGGSIVLTAPTNSVFLGSSTQALANGDANETVIGYGATGHGSNTVTIGGPSTVKTYFTGVVITSGYTVASLPAGTLGARAFVTDAVAPTFLGALTGGGSSFSPVIYNGTAWVSN